MSAAGRPVDVNVAPNGNAFMAEIASWIVEAAGLLGHDARLVDDGVPPTDRSRLHLVVAPVCEARTLADGRPPLGIACLQQDLARVYGLPDDPEACLEDFLEEAALHAFRAANRLERSEASVARFLELSDVDEAG